MPWNLYKMVSEDNNVFVVEWFQTTWCMPNLLKPFSLLFCLLKKQYTSRIKAHRNCAVFSFNTSNFFFLWDVCFLLQSQVFALSPRVFVPLCYTKFSTQWNTSLQKVPLPSLSFHSNSDETDSHTSYVVLVLRTPHKEITTCSRVKRGDLDLTGTCRMIMCPWEHSQISA